MPLRDWHHSGIFNDFLRKIDCAYFLCVWLHKSSTRMVAFSVQASLQRGPFDRRDHERLQPLVPHIARALEIRDRLESNAVRAETLALGMDRATFGLIILDSTGRMLEANAAAERMLRSKATMFRDAEGVLRLRGAANSKLQEWIVHGSPHGAGAEGVIHVERPLQQPLSLLITPIPEVATAWCGSHPRWMLFCFDPEAGLEASINLLEGDLGLSGREAEIAALLATGNDLQEICMRLRISIHTVRVHLKTIFSKTGVHSQSELVRRVLTSAAGGMRH